MKENKKNSMTNNAWANFNASKALLKSSNSNNSEGSSNGRIRTHEFEMRQGLENHYGGPIQEEPKVAQYVQYIHAEMYPSANSRPTNWINAIVGTYKTIRRKRVIEFRKAKGLPLRSPPGQLSRAEHAAVMKEKQSAMKGLRMHIIVGCILRCLLVQDNVGIPARILLRYMNNALKHSASKGEKTQISLEQFEKYRYDSRSKGIKDSLIRMTPRCYNKQDPMSLVSFTGNSLLGLTREEVLRARRMAKNIEREFPDTTPAGDIAIGALFCILVSKGMERSALVETLAMTQTKLTNLYKVFKESSSPAVNRDLQTNRSPSSLFRKSPMKRTASKK